MKKFIPATAAVALIAATGAMAQTTPPTTPSTPPAQTQTTPTTPMAPSVRPTTPVQSAPSMTEAEAKALIDAKVMSSDKKNVGEVAAIQRDSDGKVTELHADIGGFLGMGETRVRLMPSQFTVVNKEIQLTLTAEAVNALPKIEKK